MNHFTIAYIHSDMIDPGRLVTTSIMMAYMTANKLRMPVLGVRRHTNLGEEELRRVNYCSRHKLNFISGTMSPADKDEAANELESL